MSALPGGISSLIRRLPDLDGKPFKVANASGAHLTDTFGSTYIDYAMAMGATILGHASPPVVEACIRALRNGSMPGFSHDGEMLAAEALASLAPALSRATFLTTGSEAVHLACRIARRSTGRPVIAKIAGGFDGWYDDLAIGWSGSPEADLSGRRPVIRDMTLLRFNDLADVEALFAERNDIAAVIVEPMLANAGSLQPDPDYFKGLQRIARKNGAMVIADEVLMGLRLGCGVSCYSVGLQPDLVTLGKAIGSGLPVAAVLGTPEAFAAVEDGRAPRAGTYHGNPLVTAAVKATIDTLQTMDYPAFLTRGETLRRSVEVAIRKIGPACTSGYGSVFSLWLSDRPPTTYDEAKAALRPDLSARLHLELRRRGVVTIPGGWGRVFLSFAHSDNDLAATAAAFDDAAGSLHPEGRG